VVVDGQRWIRAVAAVGVLMTACSGGGSSEEASSTTGAFPSGAGTIVIESGWASDARIVALDLLTLEEEVISGGGEAHVPDVTDDGTRVVWAGPSTVDSNWPDTYLHDRTTGETRRVGSGGGPTWTFDEQALLVSRPDGVHQLELDGSAELVRAGEEVSGSEIGEGTFVFGDPRTLTIVEGDDETVVFDGGGTCGPSASDLDPDGRTLAFTVWCTEADDPAAGLYAFDLRSEEPTIVRSGDLTGAAWSPAGTSIATVHRPDPDVEQNELWLVDARTGASEVIRSGGWSSWPVWLDLP
jgi:hypothetical protein